MPVHATEARRVAGNASLHIPARVTQWMLVGCDRHRFDDSRPHICSYPTRNGGGRTKISPSSPGLSLSMPWSTYRLNFWQRPIHLQPLPAVADLPAAARPV